MSSPLNIWDENQQKYISLPCLKGEKGEKGEKGDRGNPFTYSDFTAEQLADLKGEKGDKGDTGAQGLQGIQGDKGDKGDKGNPFIYEDFTPEQLAALKGEKGDKGDTGAQGLQGIQGEKGDKGDAFTYDDFTAEQLSALKGDKGNDGYTPQKGVDYFTPEDIAGLNIPSVDKIYNPASENAQSGLTVAEAIEDEKSRADNTFSNALKSSKSGSAILIDDISPVTHEMSVKISSDTVTDLTAVKVTRYGKNLIQTNIIEVTSPAGVENLIWQGNISGKLSFSLDNSEYTPNPSNVNSANFKFVFGDGTARYLAAHGSHMYLNTSSPLKEIYFLNWGKGTGVIKNIQLEIGSSETDYEPYVEPTEYTPNADGTVNGVTSLYPNTTLMTDTEGVTITCEYNKDINTFSGADVRVPTKTSELINDSNFATQDYVDEEIANFDFIKIVTELPETGLVNRTYFVPKQDPATNDLYDEYMWVDGKWELITTKQIEVDLTEYVKHTDINQSYDPTSENAQSGNAVAEALTTLGGRYETVVEEIWQRNKIFTPVSFDYENQVITVSDGDLDEYSIGDKIYCIIVPNISDCTLNSLGGAAKFFQTLTVLSATELSVSNALHADTTVANFHLESIANYFLLAKNLSAKKIRVTVNGASSVPNTRYTYNVFYGITAGGFYVNMVGYASNSLPLRSSMRLETEIISPYTLFSQISIGYNCASANPNYHWKNNGAAWVGSADNLSLNHKDLVFNSDGTKIENLWRTTGPWHCNENGQAKNDNPYGNTTLHICNGTYIKIERWVE